MDNAVAIFTIISATAAAIYAFIAFRTLIEIKKQREASFQPDIIAIEKNFYGTIQKDAKIQIFKTNKVEEGIEEFDVQKQDELKLSLFNIGLGAAKKIKVKYYVPIEKMIHKTHEMFVGGNLEENIEIKKTNGLLEIETKKELHNGKEFHSLENQKIFTVDYLLPSNISKSPYEVRIPSYITTLYGLYIYGLYEKIKSETDINNPDFHQFEVVIEYYDISNKKHTKIYIIKFIFCGGAYESTMYRLDVNEKSPRRSFCFGYNKNVSAVPK